MYNINTQVDYETDEEYRESIKNVFNTNLSDEDFILENDTIKTVLDDIYEKTKDNKCPLCRTEIKDFRLI